MKRYLVNVYNLLGMFGFNPRIGPKRIKYNAHRVFSLDYLLELLSNKFHIDYFSFVDDKGDLHENVELADENIKNNYECLYGCGVFELTKL